MKIKFIYSVAGVKSGAHLHRRESVVEVEGDPTDQFGWPSHRQLWLAESQFRDEFMRLHYPNGYLLKFEAVPVDGSRALFSSYTSTLSA
jgi:hypothetical protein